MIKLNSLGEMVEVRDYDTHGGHESLGIQTVSEFEKTSIDSEDQIIEAQNKREEEQLKANHLKNLAFKERAI